MLGDEDKLFGYDFPAKGLCCPCGRGLPAGHPTLRILKSVFNGHGNYVYRCIDCGNEYVKEISRAYARINKAIGEAIAKQEV